MTTLPSLRVALVAEDFYPQLGGVPEHVHHLAIELQRAGHDVTVISSHMRGMVPRNFTGQYPVLRVGRSVVIYANGGVSRVTAGRGLTGRLENLFRAGRFDVIHVQGGLAPTFGLVAPKAARRAGIPVVATFHSWFPRSAGYRVFRRPFQRLLDQHAATIAVSPAAVEAHARYFTANWEIIPNGVDIGYFHPNGRGPAAPLPSGPRLLYFHRLEPRNHLPTLLRAMPAVLDRYPGARLIVAGEGPWGDRYRRMASPLGEAVQFAGRIENRSELYQAADLYLCPTMRAGFGITLLEAMACGTPLVVADNAGFRSVVDRNEAVILAHDDAHLWAEAIVTLAGDPARRQAMAVAGIAKAARYAWPLVAAKIIAVYHRVAGRADQP